MAIAQETVDTINQDTLRLNAETARLTAETARLTAQRVRDQAAAPVDDRLKTLQAQNALENAEKDLANSATEARIAQAFGTVKNASYTGAVELDDKTGTLEAKLLATKAIAAASQRICAQLCGKIGERPVLVAAGTSYRSPERLELYRFRVKMLKQVLDSALTSTRSSGGAETASALPAVVSAGLDAAGKLLSFFKSDYKMLGFDQTTDESVAMYAVAGGLSQHGARVYWPAVQMPAQRARALESIVAELQGLLKLRNQAQTRAVALAALAAREERVAAEDGEDKEQALAEAASYRSDEAVLREAVSGYDALLVSLTTPSGTPARDPIIDLVSDMALESTLQGAGDDTGSLLLLIRLESAGGGMLLKKNLLTGLGAPPLYHMGGAAVSYLLLDGRDGRVIDGGTIAQHGGYTKSSRLASTLGQ
ncbi:hypothetical protein AZ78_3951 [Lysobacter capsici AZ78]|uniref:Uncharacterized protein n=2 Tax=Lysobacter capsici TaxID=435897 RepID=A0A120AHM4_9GAMM|nr:hypothetical protein AZ78_3951 [Lysobacter capsici AZ78]